jgi:hypothetical protein
MGFVNYECAYTYRAALEGRRDLTAKFLYAKPIWRNVKKAIAVIPKTIVLQRSAGFIVLRGDRFSRAYSLTVEVLDLVPDQRAERADDQRGSWD